MLNAIELRRHSDVKILTLNPPTGVIWADGITETTITGQGAPPFTELSVTTTHGVLLAGPDDKIYYVGRQIKSDASGNFSFVIKSPTGAGPATINVRNPAGLAYGSLEIYFHFTGVWKIDFNSGSSPTN